MSRLIEFGTLGLEAGLAGEAERYARARTPHTGQVWWARRPHSAMRALVFATLVKNTDPSLSELATALATERDGLSNQYAAASAVVASQYDKPPTFLDMFGGGGTIPHEAAALGAKVHSVDNNALSVFLQKVNLEYSQKVYSTLGKPVAVKRLEAAGKVLLSRVARATDLLYPSRQNEVAPLVYVWTYKIKCPACSYEYYLSKRPWLAKRSSKSIHMTYLDGEHTQLPTIGSGAIDLSLKKIWTGRSGSINCPKCDHNIAQPSIKDCTDEIVAVVTKGAAGKSYSSVNSNGDHICSPDILREYIEARLGELGQELPKSVLPKWSGIANPSIYGMDTHADILNARQSAVCLTVLSELKQLQETVARTDGVDMANFLVGNLSAFVDQLVDWNSRLSMWIAQNEQVGRALSGPGLPMLWDYAEVDALGKGPANLWDKLKRIVLAAEAIPIFRQTPTIHHGQAQRLPLKDGEVDAIVTDPPYYDNIFYNILADCIYSWKRLGLSNIGADLFKLEQTDAINELVASKQRQGSSVAAHDWYCQQLTLALSEAARVLKPDGVISFVYGHSSILGWAAIVTSFRASGLIVERVEPLSIERRHRPRAMTSEAVNTCVVIVAKKRAFPLSEIHLEDVLSHIAARQSELLNTLNGAGWSEYDAGMALFATAAGELACHLPPKGVDDTDLLKACELRVTSSLPGFSMQKRSSI